MANGLPGGAGGGVAPIAGAAALGAVLVAGAVAFVSLRDPGDDRAGQPDPAAESAPAPADDTPAEATDMAEAETTPTPPEPVPPAPPLFAPRFDVVRVDGTGSAIIAGQAETGASVTLKIDGEPVEVVSADPGGNFVAMLALSPSDVPRVLSLEAAQPDGDAVPGDETVIIAPFSGEAVAAAAAPDPAPPADDAPEQVGADAAAQPGGRATPPEPPPALRTDRPGVADMTIRAPDTPDAVAGTQGAASGARPAQTSPEAAPSADTGTAARPGPPGDAPVGPDLAEAQTAADGPEPSDDPAPGLDASPEAPAVLMAGDDGLRVMQAPGSAPGAMTAIQLDAITYDTDGDVTLAGRGPSDSSVRVTLNNRPINMGEIGPGGQWSLGLPDVDPGTYTLRLEQLNDDGMVTRTVETPFLREDPARIRDNPMLVDPGSSVITVQRGFTLWGIAEANFGEGILYVQIFEENRAEIRDPDLIFPGQIFALPDLPRAGGDSPDGDE